MTCEDARCVFFSAGPCATHSRKTPANFGGADIHGRFESANGWSYLVRRHREIPDQGTRQGLKDPAGITSLELVLSRCGPRLRPSPYAAKPLPVGATTRAVGSPSHGPLHRYRRVRPKSKLPTY